MRYLQDNAEIIVDDSGLDNTKLIIPVEFALILQIDDVIVFETIAEDQPTWLIESKNYNKVVGKAIKIRERVIISNSIRFFASLV